MKAYPLRPVITNDPHLPSLYNDHPVSVFLTSSCLTPTEASKLMDDGAVFETVVLLDDDGEELVNRINATGGDPELTSRVERIRLSNRISEDITQIHANLQEQPVDSVFFVMGGG